MIRAAGPALLAAALGLLPGMALLAAALPATPAAAGPILDELRAGFSERTEILGLWTRVDLRESPLNAGNRLGLARHEAALSLRPDLRLAVRRVTLTASPRADVRWRRFAQGPRRGEDETVDSLYVNAWRVELRVHERLLASYGRENLQWGPSCILSPSNPFNRGNGRNDLTVEEPGLDYARLMWCPGRRWAVEGIANTGEGRFVSMRPFDRRYAVKAGYTGEGVHASAIVSRAEEDDTPTTGAYVEWNVSDALLLHLEGGARRVWADGDVVVGGSWTFTGGQFAVVEYFRDGTGCGPGPIEDCFNPFTGKADPADLLFRRNYVLVQITDPSLAGRWHLTGRGIFGLDDGSQRLIGIAECELGSRYRAILVGAVDSGSTSDEFGSVFRSAVRAGMSVVF